MPDGEALAPSRAELAATAGDHWESARFFKPDRIWSRDHTALAVGAPSTVSRDENAGRYWIARKLGLERDKRFWVVPVESSTTSESLKYTFDTVEHFRETHDPARHGKPIDKGKFVRPGALWKAYEAGGRSAVLIDEIDKAPRDFPNDLLHVVDQHEIVVHEIDDLDHPKRRAARRKDQAPPLIVITSNSERRLPDPFLRRCIFHVMKLTEKLVHDAVEARAGDFPQLGVDARAAAQRRFFELRAKDLAKKPSTAELLVWLTILGALGIDAERIKTARWTNMPARAALFKDQDDLKRAESW